jgi:hypothetical protein
VSPDIVRVWIRVIRDAVLYTVATTILATNLVLYVSRGEPPNLTWISAAAFFYGLVPALRADEWLMRSGRDGRNDGDEARH